MNKDLLQCDAKAGVYVTQPSISDIEAIPHPYNLDTSKDHHSLHNSNKAFAQENLQGYHVGVVLLSIFDDSWAIQQALTILV